MGWFPISLQGRLAQVMSAVTGKSPEELDMLDGGKDGCLPAPYALKRVFGDRVHYSEGSFFGIVIEDGDGEIDGDDMLLMQLGGPAFIGGHLSRLENGYETSKWNVETKELEFSRSNQETEALKRARKIWPEIQRRGITRFSNFTAVADDIFRTAFSERRRRLSRSEDLPTALPPANK